RLRLESVVGLDDVGAPAAGAVGRRGEDGVVRNDGRRAVGHPVGRLVIMPQQLAVLGIDAYHAARQELHVLLDAAERGDDDGGVARPRVGWAAALALGLALQPLDRGAPARVAVLLVQPHERRRPAPGRADDAIAIDERRLGVGPPAGAALEVLLQVLLPDDVALGHAQARQLAVGADDIQVVADDGRRAARPGAATSRGAQFLLPDLRAILGTQAHDLLAVPPPAAAAP